MSNSVETGAVNQKPDSLRRDGACPECGEEVDASDEHNCENGGQ